MDTFFIHISPDIDQEIVLLFETMMNQWSAYLPHAVREASACHLGTFIKSIMDGWPNVPFFILPFTSLSSYYKSFKGYSVPPGGSKEATIGYDNGLGSYTV